MPEKMKIIRIERLPDYLYVEVAGTFALKDAMDLLGAAMDERTGGGYLKVLADVRGMTGPIPLIDRYELGQYLGRYRDSSVKTALLCLPEQMMPDKFLENVARNTGALYLVTADIGEALEWLGVRDLPPKL
jgi:hypothetical protein